MKEMENALKLLHTESSSQTIAKAIEIVFSEIVDRITIIPPLLNKINELESKNNIMCIGNAIQEMMKVRRALYKVWPQLEPNISKEISENYERYTQLASEIDLAYKAEESGDIVKAKELYSSIRASAGAASIKIQAEAGLFRIAEQEKI